MKDIKEWIYDDKKSWLLDEFLSDDEIKTFRIMMDNAVWRVQGRSDDDHPSRNLNINLVGNNLNLLQPNDIYHHQVRKIEKFLDTKLEVLQCYYNNYQFGSECAIHYDEVRIGQKCYTVVIPVHSEWKANWHGSTLLYNDQVTQIIGGAIPFTGQALLFDSRLHHGVEPISKYCYNQRQVLVFMLAEKNSDFEGKEKDYVNNYSSKNSI